MVGGWFASPPPVPLLAREYDQNTPRYSKPLNEERHRCRACRGAASPSWDLHDTTPGNLAKSQTLYEIRHLENIQVSSSCL